MKSNYEIRAQKFFKMLYPYIKHCKTPRDFEYACDRFVVSHPNRVVKCYHGISRIAICTSDYVIKIDYDLNTQFGSCEDEVAMYDYVCSQGYGKYFAKITPFKYHDHKYYVMPLVKNIDRWGDDADTVCGNDDLSDFLCENFDDLHGGNYGWHRGHIVIFDYAATA